MINAGKHKAVIVDHGLTETKAGLPQVAVKFELSETGDTISWFGSFKGGAMPITVENLIRLGMPGSDPVVLVKEESGPVVLDAVTEFELVVEMDTYNGNTRPRIKFINKPGEGGGFGKKLEAGQVKSLFAGLNLAGELAAQRSKSTATPVVNPITEDDIPF